MHFATPLLLCLLASAPGQATGLEPGSPLVAPPRPKAVKESPRPPELSLARFLESPGKEPARVKLWLRQRDAWPQKAEFYSLSNRLLKTCSYGNFKEVGGRMRPTEHPSSNGSSSANR